MAAGPSFGEYIFGSFALAVSVPYWVATLLYDCLVKDLSRHPQSDVEGPERVLFTPVRRNNIAYSPAAGLKLKPSEKLAFTATVVDIDDPTRKPIRKATVEIWGIGPQEFYDNLFFNWRGRFITDDDGRVTFHTARPGPLVISDLTSKVNFFRGLLGYPRLASDAFRRPSHIHFLIYADGYETLATQLYFEKDLRALDLSLASKRSHDILVKRRATTLNVPLLCREDGSWSGEYTFMLKKRN